jgi:transcriptional regulator NrdR family protein|tara:strand:- start:555 stop:836 length:282 start_codon:yes stop_codon:yes gene_type:complete
MICPKCEGETHVVRSELKRGHIWFNKRKCVECGIIFPSYESLSKPFLNYKKVHQLENLVSHLEKANALADKLKEEYKERGKKKYVSDTNTKRT